MIKFCGCILKFRSLATSGDNTIVVENGVTCRKLTACLGFANQCLWLQYKQYFVQRLVGNHQQKCPSASSTWSDNKGCELIAVKVLHTSLLNTTVVAFKVLPLGSFTPMPVPSPPFKTILELVLWNGLQSCHHITPDVISVIKMPSFQYFLYLREQKKSLCLDSVNRQDVPTQLFV